MVISLWLKIFIGFSTTIIWLSSYKIFKSYFSKLLYNYDGDNSVYKNLGITYMAPDYESLSHMKEVADCFGLKYHIVDPNNPDDSAGFNPLST